MKRAMIMVEGERVTAANLGLAGGPTDASLNLRAVREQADRKAAARALARSAGNISGTARLLGVSRPTLYDLLRSYGLHS